MPLIALLFKDEYEGWAQLGVYISMQSLSSELTIKAMNGGITIYILIFASVNFHELLEMHSEKISRIFIFAVPEGQICNFFLFSAHSV